MSVLISEVVPRSPADKKGIKSGSTLLSINGHEIHDVLDYDFYSNDTKLHIVLNDSGRNKKITVRKDEDEDLGLSFETYLMDKQQHCKNGCIFCFIDQMPKGMRESLYFKDDDSRLSFLFGNYITLTNLSERDVERIIEMHISPVNVSVHTMNPGLRVKMMKNKNAGKSLELLYRLADAGIKLNTQLVLCPGINDGEELRYSLEKLGELYPAVQSIAAVPVGLTKFRQSLYPLAGYTKKGAENVIDCIESFAAGFLKKNGTRLAFAADEFYLKAGRKMPADEEYEDYPQLENGVGLWTSLETEFALALEEVDLPDDYVEKVSLATGEAAYPLILSLCEAVKRKYKNCDIDVYKIQNDFFGENITVAGLITGKDLIKQLQDKKLHARLIIPSVMLRSEGDMFLDSVTVEEAEEKLGVKIQPVSNDGYELLDAILNIEYTDNL